MHRIRKVLWWPLILILVMIPVGSPQARPLTEDREEQGTVLVGRISHVEGQLLRYVPDEEDWVATVQDAPFGIGDALYSNEDGRVEFIMPNNTWVRIDRDTQIRLIVLKDDVTEIDVVSGVARFYNKSSYAVIKATTPFGYVMAPAETSFDLYVGDDSVEVIALKGPLDFVHNTSEARYEVIARSASILADIQQVTAGEGDLDTDWDRWNRDRDALWAKRMQVRGKSVEYLPPRLHHHAYVLEEHGRWERVYYDGAYCYFWRPVHVSVGWAPFTVGRWTVWYGDHTWIPYEPFGYVTHHYGDWVFVRNFWYWAPPVAGVRVHLGPPLLDVGFAWYPGRVAWIHFGTHIGWVPLTPREPYYCYRRWGPRAVVVKNVNITNVNLNINRYRHCKRAVIINRHNLYSVNNYRDVRIRNISNNTIVKKYRVVPVVNNTVINSYTSIRQRYNVTNVNVRRKPDRTVIKRIQQNHLVSKQSVNAQARKIQQNVTNIRRGQLVERDGTKTPRVRNTLISANRVNRLVSQVKRKDRELKRKGRLWAENQRQARKESGKVHNTRRLPRSGQQLEPVSQGHQERQKPRKARQDRQIQVWQQAQENRRHDAERQKNTAGWTSKRHFPSRERAGSIGSMFRSAKNWRREETDHSIQPRHKNSWRVQ
jgi:hypothetical protein